jgi:hypothetical protein
MLARWPARSAQAGQVLAMLAMLAICFRPRSVARLQFVGYVGYLFLIANIANNWPQCILINLILLAMLAIWAPVLNRWLRPAIHDCGMYTTLFFNFFTFHSQ